METINDLGDQWIWNICNKIETKEKKNRGRWFLDVLHDFSSNYSELTQRSGTISTETQQLQSTAYEEFYFK